MFRPRLVRTLAVLVLSLPLAMPLCAATFHGSAPGRAGRTSPAPSHLWEWVTSLWAKNGCSLDPGGLCAPSPNPSSHPALPAPAGSSLDAGCGIDPGGITCGGGHS